MISPMRSLVEQQGASGGRKQWGLQRGILTLEERARVMQLQDLLIERFVEHREAVAQIDLADLEAGQLEAEIETEQREVLKLLRQQPVVPGRSR